MYKKILITILSILCLCSSGVYAEDIIEQQTEPVIDNVKTVEEIPSDNITETENTDVVEDTTTDTNNDREDVIEDGSNIDDVTTDTTQDGVEEPKEDNVTNDETLSDDQENIEAKEEISNDKISDEENTEVTAIEKATITFNPNGGTLSNTLTITKNVGDTYGMLSGEGKHFESSKDNENLGYANYDFGNKISE